MHSGPKIMQQWEYDKLDLNDVPRKTDDVGMLNAAGKDGWELVATILPILSVRPKGSLRQDQGDEKRRRQKLANIILDLGRNGGKDPAQAEARLGATLQIRNCACPS
jgi:hypothetical protein